MIFFSCRFIVRGSKGITSRSLEAEAQRQVRTPEQQMVWCCLQAFEAATQAGPQTA